MICILHKWSKWSALVMTYDGVHQFKHCEKCNAVKKRKAGYSIEFNLAVWNTPHEEPSHD